MDNLGKFGFISQGRIGFRVIIFFHSFLTGVKLAELYLMKSKIQACSKDFSEGWHIDKNRNNIPYGRHLNSVLSSSGIFAFFAA